MDGLPVCEKCGLRAVRHELERQGVILRFCDFCYWGELEAGETPPSRAPRETDVPTPRAKSREK